MTDQTRPVPPELEHLTPNQREMLRDLSKLIFNIKVRLFVVFALALGVIPAAAIIFVESDRSQPRHGLALGGLVFGAYWVWRHLSGVVNTATSIAAMAQEAYTIAENAANQLQTKSAGFPMARRGVHR